jgi:deoxyribodipyrimidine photolyase-related protein
MVRHLAWLLGDQLGIDNPALENLDPAHDAVLMVEAPGEAAAVWSHKARIVLFLSAMRHRAAELREQGFTVHYIAFDQWPDLPGLVERAARVIADLKPVSVRLCEAGDWHIEQAILAAAQTQGWNLRYLDDTHFLCSRREFAEWAKGYKQIRMEFFYRHMRRRHRVLLDAQGEPEGGQWNFDASNRQPFPRSGPGAIPPPARFEPDAITREVMALVEQHCSAHPGSLAAFIWPVTRAQALQALERFIEVRLVRFGPYQDAMWTGETYGWHALLSTSLNLKLLHPREVVAAAEQAWRERGLELAGVEGFIRQVLGWREFIRGVYWLDMPGMREANHFGHQRPLPQWYWTGKTGMACMREVVGQTLDHGFAHHIQRLMVTGQFALLAGLSPQQVEDWYLAVYVDAVDWVELPNVAGMALFANGGRFTSKPYIASGQYIKRQSNYCSQCRYKPDVRTGSTACPVTALYWAFLDRHEASLAANPRTALMARSVARLNDEARAAIREHAARLLERLDEL